MCHLPSEAVMSRVNEADSVCRVAWQYKQDVIRLSTTRSTQSVSQVRDYFCQAYASLAV